MIDLSMVDVCGLGTVYPAGCGHSPLAAVLAGEQDAPWCEVDRSAGYHRHDSARLIGLTAGLDLTPWLSPRVARRMSLPSRLAVASTKIALADAGLPVRPEGRTAVVAASAYGPNSWVERFFRQVLDDGPTGASPALFTETVANAPAAQVAMACAAAGPNITVTQREAGALIALLRGGAEIALGRSDRVLVVCVDEVTPLLHAVLDRFRALARPDADGHELARPFDRRRDGYLLAEGATALVLEHEDTRRRRGGRRRGRLLAGAHAFDPRAPRLGWSRDPEHLARALGACLADAPGDPGVVVSGASGAKGGDALEGRVLKTAWGERPLPPVLVPKAALGDHFGVVLAAAVLALDGADFGPTPGFSEADPELGIVPHGGDPAAPAPGRLLVSSLASGGAAAWAVLEGGADA